MRTCHHVRSTHSLMRAHALSMHGHTCRRVAGAVPATGAQEAIPPVAADPPVLGRSR